MEKNHFFPYEATFISSSKFLKMTIGDSNLSVVDNAAIMVDYALHAVQLKKIEEALCAQSARLREERSGAALAHTVLNPFSASLSACVLIDTSFPLRLSFTILSIYLNQTCCHNGLYSLYDPTCYLHSGSNSTHVHPYVRDPSKCSVPSIAGRDRGAVESDGPLVVISESLWWVVAGDDKEGDCSPAVIFESLWGGNHWTSQNSLSVPACDHHCPLCAQP